MSGGVRRRHGQRLEMGRGSGGARRKDIVVNMLILLMRIE